MNSFPVPLPVAFPQAFIDPVTPDPRTTDAGVVTIRFTEDVTDFDVSDLYLTRDGEPVDMSGLVVNQVSPSEYTIDLSSVTGPEGEYVLRLDSTPPVADIVDITPDPRTTPVDVVTIRFTEDVTGVDISDFTLQRDVGDGSGFVPVPLVDALGNPLAVNQISPSEYTIDLSQLDPANNTDIEGTYVLTLFGSDIIDTVGLNLNIDATETWVHTDSAPTAQLIPDDTLRDTENVKVTIQFSEDVTNVDLGDFVLTQDLGSGPVPVNLAGATLTAISGSLYELDLTPVITSRPIPDGTYRLTINASGSGIVDVDPVATPLQFDPGTEFIIDTTGPGFTDPRPHLVSGVDIADVTPDPRAANAGVVAVTFAEPVVGVDISDFSLTIDRGDGQGPQPVSLAGATLTQVTPQQYDLDLSAVTTEDGTYTLTLNPQGSGIAAIRTTLAADIDATTTTIPVADVSVFPSNPLAQPFFIQVGNEQMRVTAVNALTNTFTVVRGANGTVAAAHNNGDDVGAPLRVDAVETWIQDSIAPTADIVDVDPDPRIRDGGIVRVRFSEPVTGVGGPASNAFTLTRDLLDGSDIQTVDLTTVSALPVDGRTIGGNIFAQEWQLDLSSVTTTAGLYTLSLRPTGAIVDQAGNVFGGHDIADVSGLGGDPIVITAPNHALTSGNQVTITGVEGNTAANGTFTVTRIDADTFSLDGSVSNGDYTGGGQWRRTETITHVTGTGLGPIQVTSRNHGLSTGDRVAITGVGGNTAANGVFTVTVLDGNTLALDRTTGNGDYTGGGEWTPVDVVDTFRVVPIPPSAQINHAGIPLVLEATEIFTVDVTPPEPVPFAVTSPRNSAVGIVTIDFTEDVINVNLPDFILRRDGVNVPLAGLPFTQVSPSQYTIDLNIVTGAPGNYELLLNGATSLIEDLAGNPVQAAMLSLATWTTDIVSPSADIIDVTPDPRNTDAGTVTIEFTKDVTGVDISDFQLTRDGTVVFDRDHPWPGLTVTQVAPDQYTIDLSAA
ncbi:MAG TPA: hypothetical protein EYP14_13895, partial [Planctomycetaceae bacterium]|nr:hypothetical protein [Planctomycetaceae bacterium]